MYDKKHRILLCLFLATPMLSGCFSWKKKAPEDKTITVQVEQPFKQRWIERRSTELIGQGKPADIALAQAVQEFRTRYEFTGAAQE